MAVEINEVYCLAKRFELRRTLQISNKKTVSRRPTAVMGLTDVYEQNEFRRGNYSSPRDAVGRWVSDVNSV